MKYKLSEVMDLIGGGTPKTSKPEYWNGDIPWLSVKDFNNDFRYVYETEKTITQSGLENSSTKLLQRGDVIISARGTVGEIATVPFPMAFNQSCYGLRARNGMVTSDYLYYLIKHNVSVLKKNTHGSVFDTITRNTFGNVEVEIPSIETQEKIASILSDYDEKIELNNAINNNLEQQAQALFKSWFVDFEPFDGELPSSWTNEKLGNVCNCVLGGTPSRAKPEYWNGTIPWINSGEVNNFRIIKPSETITELGLTKSATKLLPLKTTVIAITGATLGQVSLLEIDACANQSVVGIIPNDDYPYEYIYPLIKQSINELTSHQTGGAQQHINKQNVESLDILVPTAVDLDKYCNTVHNLYEMITTNCFENEYLTSLRDTLLPKLMSGELDVSDIEI